MNNKVSCVIPTFRRKYELGRAIESVISQTYSNIEILVVSDNFLGDEYDVFAKQLCQKFKHSNDIKFLNTKKPKSGGGVARNLGIENSNGGYIAFLDDDDSWMPTKLEKQIKKMQEENSYACTCQKQIYINESKIPTPVLSDNFYKTNQLIEILTRRSTLFTPTLVFNKEIFNNGIQFDESLIRHQDLQLLSDYLFEYKYISLVDEVLVNVYADDASNKPNLKMIKQIKSSFFNSIQPILNSFNKKDLRRVQFAHQLEVVLLAMREKNNLEVVKELSKLPFSPHGLYDFLIRVKRRIYVKKG